jgi:hypothetical protein
MVARERRPGNGFTQDQVAPKARVSYRQNSHNTGLNAELCLPSILPETEADRFLALLRRVNP